MKINVMQKVEVDIPKSVQPLFKNSNTLLTLPQYEEIRSIRNIIMGIADDYNLNALVDYRILSESYWLIWAYKNKAFVNSLNYFKILKKLQTMLEKLVSKI